MIALLHAPDPACVKEASKHDIFAQISDSDVADWQSSIDIVLRRFAEYHDPEGAFGRRATIGRERDPHGTPFHQRTRRTRRHPDGTSSRFGFPEASHPTRPRAELRTSGRGQAIGHGPGTTRSTSHQSLSSPVVHSQRATSRRTRRCDSGRQTPELPARSQRRSGRSDAAYATSRICTARRAPCCSPNAGRWLRPVGCTDA